MLYILTLVDYASPYFCKPQSIRNYFVEINVNKATAFDGVSVKIMKIAKPVIVKPITKLINKSISTIIIKDFCNIRLIINYFIIVT
jgi:hypothetical protein